jgi:hypothetical protein
MFSVPNEVCNSLVKFLGCTDPLYKFVKDFSKTSGFFQNIVVILHTYFFLASYYDYTLVPNDFKIYFSELLCHLFVILSTLLLCPPIAARD